MTRECEGLCFPPAHVHTYVFHVNWHTHYTGTDSGQDAQRPFRAATVTILVCPVRVAALLRSASGGVPRWPSARHGRAGATPLLVTPKLRTWRLSTIALVVSANNHQGSIIL
jgi:hypothetical protein